MKKCSTSTPNPLVEFLGYRNDFGRSYSEKLKKFKYSSDELLNIYSDYKNIDNDDIFEEYMQVYLYGKAKKNVDETMKMLDSRKKNKIKIDKKQLK